MTPYKQSSPEVDWRWSAVIPPLLFGLAALLLRLWQLDHKSIWLDEAFTAYHSTFSAVDLWTKPVANKPPLFYLITSLFWSPGDGAFALRLPVALSGALSITLSWYLGKLVAGTRGAFIVALFVLLSDINIHYSQDARQYILLTVGWLLMVIAMLRMVKTCRELPRPDVIDISLLAIASLIMVHTHPVAIHYLFATLLSYIAALLLCGKIPKSFFYQPLLVCTVACVTILPWIPVGMQNAARNFSWLQQPDLLQAFFEFMSLFGAKSLALYGGKTLAITCGVALVVISMFGIAHYLLRRDRSVGVFLAGLLLLPPVMLWMTGIFKPVYMLRTITPSHLIAMTGIALAILALRQRTLRTVATITVAAVLGTSSFAYFSLYKKEDWQGLSAHLQSQISAGDEVLICEKYLYQPMQFYLHDAIPGVIYVNTRKRRVAVKSSLKTSWAPYSPSPTGRSPSTIWVASRYGRCAAEMAKSLRAITGHQYIAAESWQGQALSLTPFHRLDSRLR